MIISRNRLVGTAFRMNDLRPLSEPGLALPADGVVIPLSQARVGDKGAIIDVRAEASLVGHGVSVEELQRRLLEFGFVEGARVEVLHEGAIRHDPIAVRLDDMRVALRRRDAAEVLVLLDQPRP
jgi:ferrous iron transport protein A